MIPMMRSWIERMTPGRWYRISGEAPDLDLPPPPRGPRPLRDTDPAGDRALNPSRGFKERLRRLLGRRPHSPWQGKSGFPAITEAWNGAVFASRFGASGSMIVFGGGHDDYFGSSVHAFDIATRPWSRISDGYVSGGANEYGGGGGSPPAPHPPGSPLPPPTFPFVPNDPPGQEYFLFKGPNETGTGGKKTAATR